MGVRPVIAGPPRAGGTSGRARGGRGRVWVFAALAVGLLAALLAATRVSRWETPDDEIAAGAARPLPAGDAVTGGEKMSGGAAPVRRLSTERLTRAPDYLRFSDPRERQSGAYPIADAVKAPPVEEWDAEELDLEEGEEYRDPEWEWPEDEEPAEEEPVE